MVKTKRKTKGVFATNGGWMQSDSDKQGVLKLLMIALFIFWIVDMMYLINSKSGAVKDEIN